MKRTPTPVAVGFAAAALIVLSSPVLSRAGAVVLDERFDLSASVSGTSLVTGNRLSSTKTGTGAVNEAVSAAIVDPDLPYSSAFADMSRSGGVTEKNSGLQIFDGWSAKLQAETSFAPEPRDIVMDAVVRTVVTFHIDAPYSYFYRAGHDPDRGFVADFNQYVSRYDESLTGPGGFRIGFDTGSGGTNIGILQPGDYTYSHIVELHHEGPVLFENSGDSSLSLSPVAVPVPLPAAALPASVTLLGAAAVGLRKHRRAR